VTKQPKAIASVAPADPRKDRVGRARSMGLYGLLAHWEELENEPWIDQLLEIEEEERAKRSLERRIRNAKIGRFKPIADFKWDWPKEIDREAVEEVFRFEFLSEGANVILIGPNGVGKTTIAQNLAHEAVLGGNTVRFTTASAMLNELGSQETASRPVPAVPGSGPEAGAAPPSSAACSSSTRWGIFRTGLARRTSSSRSSTGGRKGSRRW